MEDKIGFFVCTGYGIAEALDIEALVKVAADEYKVPYCKKVDSCEGPGLEAICNDIASEGLTKALIAGISPRLYPADAFPGNVIVEKFALRDHVVWCQPPNDEDTQAMAEDYVRMYLARVQKISPLEPFQSEEEIDKSVLVVGGGVTGLTSALEAARAGYDVRLVEKSGQLGGWLAKNHQSIPTRPPYHDLEETGVEALISEVEGHSRIRVYKSAFTGEIAGAPGLFDVTLVSSGNGKSEGEVLDTFRTGAVIQATGWKAADPRPELSWGELDDVILNIDYEKMIREENRVTRPSDGKEAKTVVFVQCDGFRSGEGPSFYSSIHCLTALKQAYYLRERNDQAKAYIFYEFMRTPGLYENFYRHIREDPGIFVTRGEVVDVMRDENGSLIISARNTMPGENIKLKADLVVVPAGMEPNVADSEGIRALIDARAARERAEDDKVKADAEEQIESLSHHEGTEILNLGYRQGPDLPLLKEGYSDSHFICFPYETRRTGIYMAGCSRHPMDSQASREDGTGAALKAIQCVEMTSRGEAVHPRAGDQSYPDFNLSRCTQCKRCTEECPFGVLNEDEKGTPLLQATRCRRCGICLGACPERIVAFPDFSVDMVVSMIQAVEVPDEFEEKPRVLALMCENDAMPALDLMGQHRLAYSPIIRIIPVRCLGSVNLAWVKEAISSGYDGIILVGCRYGEDYQCHFIKGSELAESRGENIREKLKQMSMENERVELHQLQITEYSRLSEIFNDMAETIEEIGMNPFKGM